MRFRQDVFTSDHEVDSESFKRVATMQEGEAAHIRMKKSRFILEGTERIALANCRLDILAVKVCRQGRYKIRFCFISKTNSYSNEHYGEIKLDPQGNITKRPRFVAIAKKDDFEIYQESLFYQACEIYTLTALAVMRGGENYVDALTGWALLNEDKNYWLEYYGVTIPCPNGDFEITASVRFPLDNWTCFPQVPANQMDCEQSVEDKYGKYISSFLEYIQQPGLALCWAFTVHSVTEHAIQLLSDPDQKKSHRTRALNIYGSRAPLIANLFLPAIWRSPKQTNRWNTIAATESINLRSIHRKIKQFDDLGDGIFFVIDRKSPGFTRSPSVKNILSGYKQDIGSPMPVFVSKNAFNIQEVWTVSTNIIPQIPIQEYSGLKQAGMDLLIGYIHFLQRNLNAQIRQREGTRTEQAEFAQTQRRMFKKECERCERDPEETDFGTKLYHSSLWFSLFLNSLDYNWYRFDQQVKKEIVMYCENSFSESTNDPVDCLNCCQIFARYVQDIFETKRIRYSGIHWTGIERSSGRPSYYLEGKKLERELYRHTGLDNTLELRRQLTQYGILLRRKNNASLIQERVPPESTISKREQERLKKGKIGVWVLDQAAVQTVAAQAETSVE